MTIIVENVKEEFLPSMKAFTKAINAKCKVEKPACHKLSESKAMRQIASDFAAMPKEQQDRLRDELETLVNGQGYADPTDK